MGTIRVYLVANFARCAADHSHQNGVMAFKTKQDAHSSIYDTTHKYNNLHQTLHFPSLVSTDQSDNAHLRLPPQRSAASIHHQTHPIPPPSHLSHLSLPNPPIQPPTLFHPTHHIMSSSKKSSSSSSRKSRSHDPIYESGYSSSSSRSYGTTYSSMSPFWTIGTLLGASSVALGAFGAHGLKSRIRDPSLLANWGTAAHYQVCVTFDPPVLVQVRDSDACELSFESSFEIASSSSLCVTAVPVDEMHPGATFAPLRIEHRISCYHCGL